MALILFATIDNVWLFACAFHVVALVHIHRLIELECRRSTTFAAAHLVTLCAIDNVRTHTLSSSFKVYISIPELSFDLLLGYTCFLEAHESEEAQEGDDDVHDSSFSEVKTKKSVVV